MGTDKVQNNFLQDNAKLHVDKLTQKTIMDLNFEVLLHSTYSPDLASSYFHLFHILDHALRDTSCRSKSDLENL